MKAIHISFLAIVNGPSLIHRVNYSSGLQQENTDPDQSRVRAAN